jgi:molybdate-binding protein
VPDVVLAAGPIDDPPDAVEVGGWTREWGLVVPSGNPHEIEGLDSLVDEDRSFVNLDAGSGLRASLDEQLDALADERGTSRHDLTDAIVGYDLTASGYESPARSVAADKADVGLGLRSTAAALDLGFVSVGTQDVRVLAHPDRVEKPAVETLESRIGTLDFSQFPGFDS